MFIVLLKFSSNKSQAGQHMQAHNEWLKRGFDEGVFILAGTIQPSAGGSIIAYGESSAELKARVAADPFVANDVVRAEILEITPSKVDDRLKFLAA